MARTQRIIWTALPNGADGTTLKLSVFVSPRLYNNSDTQLSAYPDFVNWAKRVSEVKFSVEFKGGAVFKFPAAASVSQGDITRVVTSAGGGDSSAQYVSGLHQWQVTTAQLTAHSSDFHFI